MFKKPYDPLNAYLAKSAAQAKQQRLNASLDGVETRVLRFLGWFDRHCALLHKVWIYGVALTLSCWWVNLSYGWVNLVIIPVQTLFLGAVVAVVELPTMLALAALWGILSVGVARFWQAVRRQTQKERK